MSMAIAIVFSKKMTGSWKITDSLFCPLGLFNNSNRNKTVIVTWSYNSLVTYIFKRVNNSITLSDSYIIEMNGTIKTIIVTDCNTICLTTFGKIYYFASCKRLKELKSLSKVRCICSSSQGFALIRIDILTNRIFLEVCNDLRNDNEDNLYDKKYDITFDNVNILNSSWSDEKFTITAIEVTEKNREFLQLVTRKSIKCKEIYLFTIYNNLFGLLQNPDSESTDNDVDIFLILTVASQINHVQFLDNLNIILILLSYGSIEIIFFSKLSKSLDRSVHIIETDIVTSTYAEDAFYYSDGNHVIKTSFYYNEIEHIYEIKQHNKAIFGIVALTWVKSLRKLVCLSENNIFYRIKFTNEEQATETQEEYNEFTKTIAKQFENNLNEMMEIVEKPAKIYRQIELECNKQEIISVVRRKTVYEDLINATISFHNCIPDFQLITIYPDSKLNATRDTYFMLVNFKITWNEIFDNDLWNIVINLQTAHSTCSKLIQINSSIMQNPFNVLLHVKRNTFKLIFNISINISSCLNSDNIFMYITIPITIIKQQYHELFTTVPLKINSESTKNRINLIEEAIFKLTKNNHPLQSFDWNNNKDISITIKIPLDVTFNDLCKMFNVSENEQEQDGEIYTLILYFLGEKLHLRYSIIESYLEIITEDPGIMFYTKLFIFQKLSTEFNNEYIFSKDALRTQMRILSEIDAGCGSSTSIKSYTAQLKRNYCSLRQEMLKYI